MNRRRILAGMAMLGALLAIPSSASAAQNPYQYYVACSHSKSAPAATSCPRSSPKGAFFKSNNAHVTYKICVKFPNGQKLCASAQDAPRGVKKLNTINSQMRGQHIVKWFVGSSLVGKRTLNVT